MLIDFTFSNYRSFKDEQVFSMTRDTRFSGGDFGDKSTITAVYGSNASGKSNFLQALWSMTWMVRNSYSQGNADTGVSRDPFLLDKAGRQEATSYFAQFVAHDGKKYRYWFRCDDRAILYEELSVFNSPVRAARLFVRSDDGLVFGGSFRGPKMQLRKTVELRPNALVLSAAAAAGIACTQPAFDFFMSGIAYCDATGFQAEQPIILNEFNRKTAVADHLVQLVRYADFGIDSMRSAPMNMEGVRKTFKEQLSQQLGADPEKVDRLLSGQQASELLFEHTGDGMTFTFHVNDESRGTLAALSFFSLALRQLSRPTVTLIDEIDTSLHPALVKEFIALYVDPVTNPHGSQLVFTTHDTSLINTSGSVGRIIDPDQVWLVEKNGLGASEIYPVTDLRVRREENIGKNYLNGVYGAVPKPDFHTAFARIMDTESA